MTGFADRFEVYLGRAPDGTDRGRLFSVFLAAGFLAAGCEVSLAVGCDPARRAVARQASRRAPGPMPATRGSATL